VAEQRWWAASRAARNVRISLRGSRASSASDGLQQQRRDALEPSGRSWRSAPLRTAALQAWHRSNAMPPIWVIIAISGPAIALAPRASAEAHVGDLFGHRVAQPLPGLQGAVHPVGGRPRDRPGRCRPAGAVAPSNQVSARRTASVIAVTVPADTGAVKAMSWMPAAGQVVVDRPGRAAAHRAARAAEHLAQLVKIWPRSAGLKPPAPNPNRSPGPGSRSFFGLSGSGSSPAAKPKAGQACPQRYPPGAARGGPVISCQ
jgi:hypothetical protein